MQIVRQHIREASKTESRYRGNQIPADWTEIEFDKVSFGYEDDTAIFSALSFNIRRGEFWAVLGHSGSGKTTLLDILLGLFQPQGGTVKVGGVSLRDADLSSWHAQLAYLGQETFTFSGTLRDNLIWGSEHHHKDSEMISALRAVKLDGIAAHSSEILDIDVGENGCNLSGGEKQRLALARLFLRHASLVILDEPTTGLDTSTEKEIFDSISSCFHGTTLFMVTHREELARNADHIVRFTPEGIHIHSNKAVYKS
jgi:ATP-binding cassette subfamily B protein